MQAEGIADLPEQIRELRKRLAENEHRLEEAEETLRALRSGEVDAVLVSGPDGDQVYTLVGADEAYRVIVEEMAEGAVTLTPEGLILFSNEQFAGMLGRALEQVIGTHIQDFVAAEDTHLVSALLNRPEGRKAEVRLAASGAEPLPVYLSAKTMVLGGATCICLIVTDLSEQKRNQELTAIMEVVPVAVNIARDPGCRTIMGNHMAYELLKLPFQSNCSKSAPEEERPRHWREMKDGKEIQPEELPIQKAARTGLPVRDYEMDLVFDDGSTRCWLCNAVPLFDEAGRPRGAVSASIDITERKRSEQRLQQTQKLESIGLLAGGIAHDFNNLLVGVIGNASLAQEILAPGNEAGRYLDGIIQAGEQLAALTRQMLAYSGRGQFFLERLNLSDAIPDMSALIHPAISRRIALHFELEPELPIIEADRGQLQQVVMNLVLNAAEAIGGNTGLIWVKTGVVKVDGDFARRNPDAAELAPGEYVSLKVRDTGCGMDAITKSKIFDPFFTTKFVGRGLGLAAVSGVVRGHKGAILVTSAPGQGSCFTVMFPVVHTEPALPQPAEAGPEQDGTGTILLVDDEEVVRETARKSMERHGFEVLLAKSGLEAIEILREHPGDISLVVLDLSMPGLSGEEALPEMRKIRPGVKVVVSSGYDEAATMALFKGQRVAGFIQKPYTSGRLVEKIKTALS